MDKNANILEWYPFKDGEKVLEIYNEESVLENLNKKIDLQKCSINELNIEGVYDYIVLIGTFEYAPKIIEGEKAYSTLLTILKEHLNPEGKIILAIDNRLGIKYLAGAKNDIYTRTFEGIESKIRKEKANLLLKKEIIKFIKEANFKNYKFYYPLPDYKRTSVIFTDEFLPKSNHSKIIYPVNYEEGSTVVYNEINVIKQICEIGHFVEFANSYLIEISNEKIENNIKFVNYNVFRKDKYKTILTIDNNIVEKRPQNNLAIEHIENISNYIEDLKELGFKTIEKIQDGRIISEFVEGEELDKKIVELIKQDEIEKAYDIVDKWYLYIKERLEKRERTGQDIFEKFNIEIPVEIKEKMKFIKSGYIDLSFENVFCKEEYLFYDQEWYFENIPLEFILYRAINNLYMYNCTDIENKVSKEKFFEKYGVNEFTIYFEKLEKEIQEEILDREKTEQYRKKISVCYKNIEDIENNKEIEIKKMIEINKELETEKNTYRKSYEQQKEQRKELEDTYMQLKEENEQTEKEYSILLNEYNTSKGWKIIKGIRKILGKG